MMIVVDFDGTTVEHKYLVIGCKLPFTTGILRKLRSEWHKLILWTVREGVFLEKALSSCRECGLEFCVANRDRLEEERDRNNYLSRKLGADAFISNRNPGGLSNWGAIYEMVTEGLNYEDSVRKYKSEYRPGKSKDLLSRLFR